MPYSPPPIFIFPFTEYSYFLLHTVDSRGDCFKCISFSLQSFAQLPRNKLHWILWDILLSKHAYDDWSMIATIPNFLLNTRAPFEPLIAPLQRTHFLLFSLSLDYLPIFSMPSYSWNIGIWSVKWQQLCVVLWQLLLLRAGCVYQVLSFNQTPLYR